MKRTQVSPSKKKSFGLCNTTNQHPFDLWSHSLKCETWRNSSTLWCAHAPPPVKSSFKTKCMLMCVLGVPIPHHTFWADLWYFDTTCCRTPSSVKMKRRQRSWLSHGQSLTTRSLVAPQKNLTWLLKTITKTFTGGECLEDVFSSFFSSQLCILCFSWVIDRFFFPHHLFPQRCPVHQTWG